jgi:hypothetical protein
MGKLVGKETEKAIFDTIDDVRNMKQPRGRKSRRRVRTGGGGGGSASRSYVTITSATDAENYVGDVLEYPGGPGIVSGVAIVALGATANPFQPGYSTFADQSQDSEGNIIYYIDPFTLG